MRFHGTAAGLALLVFTSCHALACTPDQVNIIDFQPTVNANSDEASRTVWIAGSIDNFCPSATSAMIGIYGIGQDGGVLGKFMTARVDNIPPGGKSFQIENIRYRPDVTSYQLSIETTFAVGGFGNIPHLAGGPSPASPAANGSGAAQSMGGMAGYNLTRRY